MRKVLKARFQMEIPVARLAQLEKLAGEVGVRSKKELIENSLAVLEWCIDEAKKGKCIGSFYSEGEKPSVLVLPILRNVTVQK